MRMTSVALIAEIQNAWRQWHDAIAGLHDDDFESSDISRGWNLKDIVGHLAAYMRLNVRHVQSYQKRKRLVSMRARRWQTFNQREAARFKHTPLSELRAELAEAYRELLPLLPQLGDDELKQLLVYPGRMPPVRVRLGTIIRADVSRHLIEHARDVIKWRERYQLTAERAITKQFQLPQRGDFA